MHCHCVAFVPLACGMKNGFDKIFAAWHQTPNTAERHNALTISLVSQENLICTLCSFFFFFILRRMTINNFSIEYDAINSKNTFTNGDTMNGRVIVETSKEVKIQSLVFRAQGKARVCWTEHYGQHQTRVYWADEKYYDVKHHILREARQDGNILIHSLICDTLKIIQRLRDNEPILIKCFKMYDSFCSRHWSHQERKTRVSFFLQNSWQVPILHLIFFFKLMLYFSEIHFLSLYFTGKSHHLSKAVRAKLFIR